MIASALIYARNTQHLQFSVVGQSMSRTGTTREFT